MKEIHCGHYDKFTALDLIGPYETLAGHSGVTPHFVAADRSTVRCDSGLPIQPTTTFAELDRPDVVVVPGSSAWRAALDDEALVSWLAAVRRGRPRCAPVPCCWRRPVRWPGSARRRIGRRARCWPSWAPR
ncbi:DJ-1/PfpI family protein [Saccharopolyspora pogona]|uniref:DJ-1/PfpI family protein n=1 Tax=Saccharopolyspora pogona TaxID=333966 RepID=UPI0021E0B4B8|nr:DJ-1/PfpI family protein [Saccharopolyspora pogona]